MPFITETTPVIKPKELVEGQTYILRRSGNRLTHAVYLRREALYKVYPWKRVLLTTHLHMFRISSTGEEYGIHTRNIRRKVIKAVTGLEGIIMAGGIELD